ncbi:MAG: urea ABC transporter permease subunit UrtC [Acidobacteria bacterium]|nr:urea ABC transporter permease subunit UrtC [Acidobacteriota bacterium]
MPKGWSGWLGVAAVAAGALAPLVLSAYDLSLVGRFLALSILGMGLVLVWGRGGALSLGHGVFFALGAYALAMHLKLAAEPLPDFMQWNGVETLPWWWRPFSSPLFALLMVPAAPALAAAALGWLVFRRRVAGVYFALITQATALAFSTLLVSQQGLTGGFNGLTNFQRAFGWALAAPQTQTALYYLTLALVAGSYLLLRRLEATWFGRVLLASRSRDSRLRFLGYSVEAYQTAAFALSGGLAGVSGALFTLHAGVISPAMVGVAPSIEMVVWVALGGRESLAGAVAGTLLGNMAKDRLSSAFPDLWLLALGGVFLLVTAVLPEGLAGLVGKLRGRGERLPAGDGGIPVAASSDSGDGSETLA